MLQPFSQPTHSSRSGARSFVDRLERRCLLSAANVVAADEVTWRIEGRTLIIEGTEGDDQIGLHPSAFDQSAIDRVEIYAFGGDDEVVINYSLFGPVPQQEEIVVDLGSGNDWVNVWNAGASILGGAGDDLVVLEDGATIPFFDGGSGIDTIDNYLNSSAQAPNHLDLNDHPNVENASLWRGTLIGNELDNRLELLADGTVLGGAGNDTLRVSNDTTHEGAYADGGDGDDLIVAGGGEGSASKGFTLLGGAGNDTILGAAYSDNYLAGGEGDDSLVGGTGDVGSNDTLDGGPGNDTLIGPAGDGVLIGGAGDDVAVLDLNHARGDSTFLAGDGTDTLLVRGSHGSDVTFTQAGAVGTHSGTPSGSASVVVLDDVQRAVFESRLSHSLTVTGGPAVEIRESGQVHSLTITSGNQVKLLTGSDAVLVTQNLSIEAGGRLNLGDNDLVVDYSSVSPVGTWNGSAYDGVTGMIADGRITGDVSSLTALGVAEASQVLGLSGTQTATWNGQRVDGSAVLVKYTYAGDANLDGKIDIDDYGQIDFHVGLPVAGLGWFNGDFNLDGEINIDDYGIIDFVVGIQGPPL